MKCKDLEELLSAYANDELSRTQREFVEEHLASCADCWATLTDYMTVRQQLASLRITPSMPDIKQAIMLRIKAIDVLKKPTLRRWMRPALAVVPIVAIVVALLVLQPWGAFPGPQSVMAKTYAATESLQSYRMTGSMTSTFEEKTLEQSSEWEFASPDRRHGRITLDGETYEFIIIGNKQYLREPTSPHSGKLYAILLLDSIPGTKEDTLKILDSLTDLQELPDERIGGADSFHYRGLVNMEHLIQRQRARLDPAQPGYEKTLKSLEQLRNKKIEVELWIDKDDYRIRQMKQQIESSVEGTSSSIGRYYDFNEQIKIEPPESTTGQLLPGWRLVSGSP